MGPGALTSQAALLLPIAGIGLVLVNWYLKADAALAWMAALAMFVVMIVAGQVARRARRAADPALRRTADITRAVVFGSLMMIIPLAGTLARAYGIADDAEFGRRSTGILIGAFLAMLGNTMPKKLPPLSSMACDGARVQAFQRFAGWTWVLCGLATAAAWLALPIDGANVATVVVVLAAMGATIVQLLRLRRPRRTDPLPH